MEKITKDEIDRLASLSELNFTETEKTRFVKEVAGIVEMLEECNSVDTSDVNATIQIELKELRADNVGVSMDTHSVMSNTDNVVDGFFVVPRQVE